MDQVGPLLGPGDRAPDFDLPAADRDVRISLSDYYRRGPVLLLLLRGLYCSFCRRHISQLRSTCDLLQGAGIAMLGVVIASAERSRLYFRFGHSPCFPSRRLLTDGSIAPMVCRPWCGLRRSWRPESNKRYELLREMNIDGGGDPFNTMHHYDGWVDTPEDDTEFKRPLQSPGYYFIDRQGVIRWASVGRLLNDLPRPESLLALV